MKTKKLKQRITWGFSPVTRTVPSKKRYHRAKMKTSSRKRLMDEE